MPRPKANPDSLLILEVRITPPDRRPIVDWKLGTDDFVVCLIGQEGGDAPLSEKRLHYHLYIETKRSRTWLIKWIYDVARCTNGEQGNAVFFTRKPHDNTIGYVVKDGNIVCRHGCSDTFITEWLEKSRQYRTDKETTRKRKQREEGRFIDGCRKRLDEFLQESPYKRTPTDVMEFVLRDFIDHERQVPSRTQMECLIVGALYKYEPRIANSFYLKTFF